MNFNRISILTAFALRNRMTSRSPHLTETAIESSIANGCQAKRNQPSDFGYYLFEKEKLNITVVLTATQKISLRL